VSLGIALFASVVLILAVYHRGFRKVMLWCASSTIILALLGAGSYFAYDKYTTRRHEKAHKEAVKDCIARFPNASSFEEATCDKNPGAVPIPVPPGATPIPGYNGYYTYGPPAKKIGGTSANITRRSSTITATVTCNVVVYDREQFGEGDPLAIDSLHEGETVQYIGHVTVGDQDIISVHGRRGYVRGCVEVKP
jgi:hypothetical protein